MIYLIAKLCGNTLESTQIILPDYMGLLCSIFVLFSKAGIGELHLSFHLC